MLGRSIFPKSNKKVKRWQLMAENDRTVKSYCVDIVICLMVGFYRFAELKNRTENYCHHSVWQLDKTLTISFPILEKAVQQLSENG